MKKIHQRAALLLALLLLVIAAYFLWDLTTFPGRIKTPAHQPTIDHQRQYFQDGVLYRHDHHPPMLDLRGDHYEMGLQYGVLLRPQILEALKDYDRILHHSAREAGVPRALLMAMLNYRAKRMSRRLPERFRDEIRGISRGSGVPEKALTTISLLYDVVTSRGCTGVLMRTENGGIMHGHSQEPYGFGYEGLVAKHTLIVRYRAEGYHTVTHIDPILFLGVEMGYNDQGLTYTEETYSIRKTNPTGFPIVYLARQTLEEAATLDEVCGLLDGHSVAAPGGMLWSSRRQGDGMRIELLPTGRARQAFTEPILWNFNNVVDTTLARQQHPRSNLAGFNRDREHLAAGFPPQPAYTVEDAVAFLRTQRTPDGMNYAWSGSRGAIANAWGQQVIVFDPQNDGFYLALGKTFAALKTFYRYYDDFSRPPESFLEAVALEPVMDEAAAISTGLMNAEQKLEAYIGLCRKYPKEANAHFLVALESFRQNRWDYFAPYAEQACRLAPKVSEYQLYAGLAAYRKGDLTGAGTLLETIGNGSQPHTGDGKHTTDLSPEQELYRLTALVGIYAAADRAKSARYEAQKQAILDKYAAQDYYEAGIRTKFEQLQPTH